MKTIAFCNSTLAWGGGENWHLEAALYMAEQGYNVIVLAHEKGALYDRAKKHEKAGFAIQPLSIGRLSFLNPMTVRGYARFLRKNSVDTVIMNLPQDLKCMGPAARKAGIPRIIYRRGSALPVKNSALNRWLYGRILTGLIVNSEATKREVYRHNDRLIPAERVVVIPNGIDIEVFEKRLQAADRLPGIFPGEETFLNKYSPDGSCRDASCGDGSCHNAFSRDNSSPDAFSPDKGLPNTCLPDTSLPDARLPNTCLPNTCLPGARPVIVGNAGRLNKQKGQHYLLYLAKALESHGVDYRLVIAGSGERREELEALAKGLGVAGKVHFCGFLHDTSPFWKTIDIFALTSLWEGFGYVLLEAMLSAKPIVAFGVSNIPELVEDGKNGFLLPLPEELPDSPTGFGGKDSARVPDMEPMAQAVRRLAEDADLRRRMGEAGRAFANPAFDQKTVMKTLLTALETGPLSGNRIV